MIFLGTIIERMNIMKKKLIVFVLALLLCLSLAGCTDRTPSNLENNSEDGDSTGWVFDRPVEIVMPAPEGSGVDMTMRKLEGYLKEELGTNIILTNMAGASGVTGFTWARGQEHDGYLFQYTSPSAVGAAAMGNFDFDFFSEVKPLTRLLNTYNVIFTRKDAPFTNYEELVDHATANPGKVSIAVQSMTGIDGACMGKFLEACELDLNMVNFEAESVAACISGQVDLIMDTYGECEAYVESGDLIPIIQLSEERNKNLPDVPCAYDLDLDAAQENWYGFTCFVGTPDEAQDAFVEAIMKCSEIPEWKEFLEDAGFNSGKTCTPEEFAVIVEDTASAMERALSFFKNANSH